MVPTRKMKILQVAQEIECTADGIVCQILAPTFEVRAHENVAFELSKFSMFAEHHARALADSRCITMLWIWPLATKREMTAEEPFAVMIKYMHVSAAAHCSA